VERAVAAGVDARLDVWEGMVHGFLGGVGRFAASADALEISASFLRQCFAVAAVRRH
jgi:monoterpene epsilon-lactone hydrolase